MNKRVEKKQFKKLTENLYKVVGNGMRYDSETLYDNKTVHYYPIGTIVKITGEKYDDYLCINCFDDEYNMVPQYVDKSHLKLIQNKSIA